MHQSAWQMELLARYGEEIVLMDGSYNTTVNDFPLFFLCVNSNVGFTVVASFIVGSDTKATIKEGLSIISQWNSNWHPQFVMFDCNIQEFDAVETTFPGSVFL